MLIMTRDAWQPLIASNLGRRLIRVAGRKVTSLRIIINKASSYFHEEHLHFDAVHLHEAISRVRPE